MSSFASSSSAWASNIYADQWAPAYRALEGLIRNDEPLFEPQDLFEIFLAAREGTGPGAIYFNYEVERNLFSRQRGEPTPPECMPSKSDRTWDGYSERVKKALDSARYCLRLTEVHACSGAIYKRLCKLLAPLDPAFATGKRCIRTTIFMGDYDYTPFGAHVDPYPQIQCVITGTRKALFWDSEYWVGRSEEERLAPWNHLDVAHQVTMHKGDAVYWAGDYEHAFSARGEFTIALTISFPEIPAPETAVEQGRRRSAHHFLNVPPARPVPAWRSDQLFRGDPLFPLEIVSANDSEIVVAGAGNGFTIPEIPAIPAFVARVNERVPFRAADLGELDVDTAQALVDVFYTHYCIEAVEA